MYSKPELFVLGSATNLIQGIKQGAAELPSVELEQKHPDAD